MSDTQPPKLLAQVRTACRARQFSDRTAEAYCGWVRRFVLHQGRRHPRELGASEVGAFLSHLANERDVSAATQHQAASALLFLYREVLELELAVPHGVLRPRARRRVKVVFTRQEAAAVLAELAGEKQLAAALMYGSGLRLLEALTLRVKDLDFDQKRIQVRSGKGGDDRITMLPAALERHLRRQLATVMRIHDEDLKRGAGYVALPDAFARKAPHAARQLAWQWLFPAHRKYTDDATGQVRRHHLHETAMQRAVTSAVKRAGIVKRGSCHTFRHSFATHLLKERYTVLEIKELLGHKSLKTTQDYLQLLDDDDGVKSPLDLFDIRI